jgi:hypothetical protein
MAATKLPRRPDSPLLRDQILDVLRAGMIIETGRPESWKSASIDFIACLC